MKKGKLAELACAALVLLLAPHVSAAESFKPRNEYEELIGEPKPVPEIPAGLASVLRAKSPDKLLVKSLDGNEIEVDIEWYDPEEFKLYVDGRYLGFSYIGHEDYGYILVDRAASGETAVMQTGNAPVFSPDGRLFAAAEMSEAAFSNLEGIALWERHEVSTKRRFFTDAVPSGFDWRVEGWTRKDCVAFSTIALGWHPDQDWETAMAVAPRQNYALKVDGPGIELRLTYDRPGCTDEPFDP